MPPVFSILGANASVGGACTFPSTVTLGANLGCAGKECGVDSVKVVRLRAASGETVFFEYLRPPCVSEALFEAGVQVRTPGRGVMCADPRASVASTSCCSNATIGPYGNVGRGSPLTRFEGEEVTLAAAAARCRSAGRFLCKSFLAPSGGARPRR